MLLRKRFHPEGHLSIGIALNHSHGLRCGQMIFIGGEAAEDAPCAEDPAKRAHFTHRAKELSVK